MTETKQLSYEVFIEDGEITLAVDAEAWYTSSRMSGPPENCFEADAEFTIQRVFRDGHELGIETWSKWEEEIIEAGWEEYDRKA